MTWFAVLVAVLLIAGLVAGYGLATFLPKSSTTSSPGPVTGLSRPSTIPEVQGWYRNTSVNYLDFGTGPNVTAPILAFFEASSPDTPVAGQLNVIDTIPGQPGYSDFWLLYKVLAPSGYMPNSIRSLSEAVASGYPIEVTNVTVNCPVVNPGTTLQGSSENLTQGWYRDRAVSYFDRGTNTHSFGQVIQSAPIYTFLYANGGAVPNQRNVIDAKPGSTGYSDLWRVVQVVVNSTYVANSLQSVGAIEAAAGRGQLTLTPTTVFVNCPVVG